MSTASTQRARGGATRNGACVRVQQSARAGTTVHSTHLAACDSCCCCPSSCLLLAGASFAAALATAAASCSRCLHLLQQLLRGRADAADVKAGTSCSAIAVRPLGPHNLAAKQVQCDHHAVAARGCCLLLQLRPPPQLSTLLQVVGCHGWFGRASRPRVSTHTTAHRHAAPPR
jgi:hypothetical protein